MQVESQPNKYKIFQDYYLYMNNEIISYSEALRLYSELDGDSKLDFEKFYKDETGYEIITSGGYGLDYSAELKTDENGKLVVKTTKKTNKKKSTKTKQSDGTIKWTKEKKDVNVYEVSSSALKSANIDIKYSIEAFAKKSGKILDPKWAGYSAEEIIQMFNDGVDVPQDVVDIANSILQTTGANVEGTDENPDGADETTEKEPYLELLPKAKKKIEKCNDTNEKISDKIDDLLPEKQKQEKNLKNKMKEQKDSLREYENQLREWRRLQDKINHGEALSDSEAKKYAQITGMLEDKNNEDDIQFDKKEITRALNELNIWAILGEKLADETIEIGDTLADYTSETNYKMTSQTVSHEIGSLGTFMAMAQGKNLAKEANKIGHDTKEYASDTTNSVSDIASALGVENSVVSKDELQNHNIDELFENQLGKAEDILNNQDENSPDADDETKTPETTAEEDFIVNDKNVSELIKEGEHIHSDMTSQTVKALRNTVDAKNDKKFSKYAKNKITKIIKQYQTEEEKREEEIAKLEQENKEAKEKLEKLTGKSGDELDKEINNTSDKKEEDNNSALSESDKKEVENLKARVQSNNQKITELRADAESSITEFKNKTVKEKARISSAVPEENNELEANKEYKEKIIPKAKEDLNFTDNSGETLAKMGKYRIIVGMEQIAALQLKKGFKNVTKGTISAGIGLGAMIVGSLPTPKLADKATASAIKNETSAIEGLNQADAMISSITGEETTQSAYDSNKQAEQDKAAGNAEDGAKDTGDGTTTTTPTPEAPTTPEVSTTPAKAAVQPQTDGVTQPTEENLTGAAAPVEENPAESTPKEVVTQPSNTETTDGKKEENLEEKNNDGVIRKAAQQATSSSSKSNSNKKEEITTDKAKDNVNKVNGSAKDSAKDSEETKKDEDKTTKQLEKETKRLVKTMKKDEKEIVKMTKESEKAAQKQEEMVVEFEAIVAENEQLSAEDANIPQAQQQTMPSNQAGKQLAPAMATVAAEPQQNANQMKIQNNDAKLTQIGTTFEVNGKIITRNSTKIVRLQKSTKAIQKRVNKKTKTIEKKSKAAQKKEQEKQKKLAKQLGVVGVAENVFSITLATGTILLLSPFTQAVGATMVKIGTYGVASCGVTKATINLANGNLTAALMSIGQTALTVAASTTGVGQAAGGVLGAVTAGLNVVSSSADLVNNVRAIQGKEASGVFSKISAIAGAASAITSASATLGTLGQSGTFGQVAKIGSVVGSALSSTSQLMTEFGGESKVASLLGTIGGAISMAASVGMLVDSKANKTSDQNDDNKESQDKTNSVDDKKGDSKETQQKQVEKNQAEKEIKKAEQDIKTEENKNSADNKVKTDDQKQTPKEKLEAAKNEREAQKSIANNEENSLNKSEKQNMIESGASKEYANISDDELAGRIEYAQKVGDTETVKALTAEMTKRGEYKEKMAVIADNKAKKAETISKVTDAVGQAVGVATNVLNMNNGNKQQQKKKGYVAGNLTKRTKEIIKKNKKRIAALAKKGY